MGLSLTAVDILTIAVLLVSAGFAMFRGLIHESLAVMQWLVAGFLALRLAPYLQPLVHGHIFLLPPWLEWSAVVLVTFVAFFFPLAILSGKISAMVRRSPAGPADRILGLVFGVGRGLVIVGLVYIVYAALVPPRDYPEALTKARLFPVISTTSGVLRSLIPGAQDGSTRATIRSYGAGGRTALERLFQTSGGGGDASR